MAMIDEPVRGSLPSPAFYALPGIERARMYYRDQAPRPPIHHLTGVRITQVVNGSAVVTVPASPWFAHPNGDFDVSLPAEAALEIAALTVAPPATHLVLRTLHYAQLRSCSPESGTFMGRGTVIHTTRSLAFAEARVEDAEGRLIAHATGHVAMVPIDPPPDPAPVTPAEHPTYTTPDPYRRPLPSETPALFDYFATHGWMTDMWKLLVAGELPNAPLYELVGVRGIEVDRGMTRTEIPASAWLQGIDPYVAPGLLATMAFDSCGGATLSLLEPGLDVAMISAATRFSHAVPADDRPIVFRATGSEEGDSIALECDVAHDGQPIGHVSATARAIPIKSQARRIAPEPILTTVLFTDIVGSTSAADAMGDAQWKKVLHDHRGIVRSELERLGGREVNTTGDGFLATFDSPSRAVECARAIRDAVRRLGIEIRAGIHTGECEVMGRDISGTAVNVASRIESCAGAGEVWFSGTVRDLLAGATFTIADRGPHELKGIPGEMWLYSLKEAG